MSSRFPLYIIGIVLFASFFSCTDMVPTKEVRLIDSLNGKAYAYRYRSLDSSYKYADAAYRQVNFYKSGKAEASNNLGFCAYMNMDFDRAEALHKEVYKLTKNELELLIADIGLMKICQRTAMNKEYYDILLGQDLSVYASYYEPWGYTPLESVAFHVPTITTDLAGFGLWVNSLKNQHGINDGVEVLHRSDYNYSEVADGIKDTITLFADKTDKEVKEIRKRAAEVAEQALWKHFIQYYYEAYDIALRKARIRQLS